MADVNASHVEALHKLQAMLNLTLTEIGKTFDKPNRRNPNSLARTKHQLRTVLGEVELNFHDALDELETELSRARDVMRRDLGSILDERRSKLEQTTSSAMELSQPPVPTEDIDMTDAPSSEPAPVAPVAPMAPVAPIAPMAPPMIAAEVKADPAKDIKAEPTDIKPNDTSATTEPQLLPSTLGTTTQPSEATKTEEPQIDITTTAPPTTETPAPTQDDTTLGLPFDSVFDDLPLLGDATDASLTGDLDFDMSASGELLPGLESYADMASDLTTAGSGENDAGVVTAAPATTAPATKGEGALAGNELTADDFSFWKGEEGDADGAGDGVMDGSDAFAELFSFTDFDGGSGEGAGGDPLDELF